jgi:hypothetical protein
LVLLGLALLAALVLLLWRGLVLAAALLLLRCAPLVGGRRRGSAPLVLLGLALPLTLLALLGRAPGVVRDRRLALLLVLRLRVLRLGLVVLLVLAALLRLGRAGHGRPRLRRALLLLALLALLVRRSAAAVRGVPIGLLRLALRLVLALRLRLLRVLTVRVLSLALAVGVLCLALALAVGVLAVGRLLLPVPLRGAGRRWNPRRLLVVVRWSLPAAAPGAREIGPAAQAEQIALLEGLITDWAIQGSHDTSPARTPARSSVDVR